jgi:hypothetical protein
MRRLPMIYLIHDGFSRLINVAMYPLWTQVAAPNCRRTGAMPRLQIEMVEQGTHTRDRAGAPGGAAW